jgi:cytochrome c peroxidase
MLARIIPVTLCLLGMLLPVARGFGAAAEIVGRGDDRSGYETDDYRSRSERIPQAGERADLTSALRQTPLGLPDFDGEIPAKDLVDLGRRLFFDRRLSFNGTLSCGMCHVPEQGFTQNELATPVGFQGRSVKRNAPSLYNVAFRPRLFHDGRESSLELQFLSPLLAANEMANPSIGSVLERIGALPEYRDAFTALFGRAPDLVNLGAALAAYQRGLVSADSPFDRWHFGGDGRAIEAAAKRGFAHFRALGCDACHTIAEDHAHFTDDAFHDTGIGYRAAMATDSVAHLQLAPGQTVALTVPVKVERTNDLGRYEATQAPEDRWRYRTPTLRNVALTAPYMHDGSLRTLEAVIDYYAAGGAPHEGQDPRIVAFGLDEQGRADVVAFLRALTGSNVDALAADARATDIGDP